MPSPSLKFVILGDPDPAKRALRDVRGEADKQAKGIGDSFKKIGGIAAGIGVAAFFKGAITQASDLNETINKSSTIFGSNAKAIQDWASGSEKALGLSHQAALEAAASFGDMFSQIGFAGDKAADLSTQVVQMAADLGSFNNLGTDDVLERLAGGFRGEYDSLQKLIPNISAARVQQEALTATGKTNATQLTAQEKAQATLNIVMKDGARASGDFARTSGGFANQQKILTAQFQDLQATIGQELLPILVKGADVLSDILGFVRDNSGEIEVLAISVGTAYVAFKSWRILTDVSAWLSTARVRYAQYVAELSYGNKVQRTQSAVLRSGAVGALGATAAIVGVGFAIAQMVDKAGLLDRVKKEIDGITQSTDTWRDEIVEANGALTDNIKLDIAKQLQDTGVAAEAAKAGISLNTLTDAVIGGTAAVDNLRDSWDEHGDVSANANAVLVNLTHTVGEAQSKALTLANYTDQSAQAQGDLGDAAGDTNDKLGEQTSKLDRLTAAFDRYNHRVIDSITADLDFRDSLANLDKELKHGHNSFDKSTQAGRDHLRLLIDLGQKAQDDAKAALEHAKATGHGAEAIDRAKEAFKADRAEIREHLKALGVDRDQVQKLLDTYAHMPKFVTTDVKANTAPAENDVQSFITRMESTYGTITINARSALNPSAYAAGVGSAPAGWAWVGERGPELMRFRGGETVVPHGRSMRVSRGYANGTPNASGAGGAQRIVIDAGSIGTLTGYIVDTADGVVQGHGEHRATIKRMR